jgi:hypothetical protein
MARALAMLLRGFGRLFVPHVQFRKPEEHDLIVGPELHLDERIIARLRRYDGVHHAAASDSAAMDIGEVRRFGIDAAYRHRLSDEDRWAVLQRI